jgi:hypothetical protein
MAKVQRMISIDPRHSDYLDGADLNLSEKVRDLLDSRMEEAGEDYP